MGEEATPKTEMINPALLDGVSANFIVKGPSGVEKSYPMRQLAVTIGRSDQCDISVKDSSMSGKHAEISKINGEIKVRDLGSANGIYLNGERIEEGELFDGDVLRLGQTSARGDEARRIVGGYRELAQKYNTLAIQVAQFASKDTENAQTLAGFGEQIADPDLKAKVVEAQELIDARSQVTSGFISGWKRLSQATGAFAVQADQALLQGNRALLPQLEKGVAGKTPGEILIGCNRELGRANAALEDKLKELEDAAGGAESPE